MLRTIYPGVLGSFAYMPTVLIKEHIQLHHVQQFGQVQLLAGVVRASIIGVLSLYSFATHVHPPPPTCHSHMYTYVLGAVGCCETSASCLLPSRGRG